jgi:tRNA-dihydrouridine synthase B
MSAKIPPLSIGDIRVDFPFILAPMAGYTDLAFRLVCRQFGSQYCVTEMMLDRLLLVRGKVRSRLFRLNDQDHPVGGQIIGNEPEVMAQAAVELVKMGFDVIDLNFACPVRKAIKRRRGGYMMREPALTLECIKAVVAVVDKPVTCKLRKRYAEKGPVDDFWRIAEGAFDAGVKALCVHARAVDALYHGQADWEFLAEVKHRFKDRTIIGSGDVANPAKALAMIQQTGVNGVAVARGALGNPWFFRQVTDLMDGREMYRPAIREQRAVLLAHFESCVELYGALKGSKQMRGFGVKYARMHSKPKEVRVAFVNVKNSNDWRAVLDCYYPADGSPAMEIPACPVPELGSGGSGP